jgi:hypothetical protein
MFDFLPDGIDPNLKIVIYFLILVHLIAFSIWIFLFTRSLGKKTDSFD